MSQTQSVANNMETRPKNPPVVIEWGPWPLWILVGTAVGSLTNGFSVFTGGIVPIGIIIGGIIGGILVGFMPSVAKSWQISKFGWLAIFVANSTLIVISLLICAYFLYQQAILAQNSVTDVNWQFQFRLTFLSLYIVLGFIAGADLGLIIRWIFRRKQKSRARWWVWVVTGILMGVITCVGLFLAFLMNAS